MSWLTFLGFEGDMPVLVANANLVTQLVHICLGLAEANVNLGGGTLDLAPFVFLPKVAWVGWDPSGF